MRVGMRATGLVAVVAFAVGACSSGASASPTLESSSPTVSAGSSAVATGSPADLSGTLTVWTYVEANDPLLKQQADAFTAKHPHVTISYVYVPYEDVSTRAIAAAGTSTGPDLFLADGANAAALVKVGALRDMTDCVNSWPTASDIQPWGARKVDGRTYGVLPYGNLIGLWYNKDILDKYGLQPPTTIDQLESELTTITKGGDGGLALDGTPDWPGAWTSRPFFTAFGVYSPEVDKPATEQVLARMASWADHGLVPRDVVGWGQGDAFQRWLAGKYAFTVNTAWNYRNSEAAKFHYGVAVMPSGTSPATVYISGETAMIGAFGANPDLACAYLGETWFSEEGQLRSLKANGLIPVLKSGLDNPAISVDPILSVFAKQASTALLPEGGTIFTANNTVWGPAWSSAFVSNADTARIARDAIAAMKQLLGK